MRLFALRQCTLFKQRVFSSFLVRETRLPIQSASRAAFSSNTKCYAEPADLKTPPWLPQDAATTLKRLRDINALIVNKNWEAAVRLIDQQLKEAGVSQPVFERGFFESARGFALDKLGRQEEAIKAFRSALSGFLSSTELASSNSPIILECFESLSRLLLSMGSHSEVVTVHKMAVDYIRPLVDKRPDLKTKLIGNLIHLGDSLMQTDDNIGALSALQDAYDLLRTDQNPVADQLKTDIIGAMVPLYQTLQRWSDALPLSEQLVKKAKDASEAAKQSGTLDESLEAAYVDALSGHADILWSMGRIEECLEAHEQCVSIFRRLYERDPAKRSVELADLLHNYSYRQTPQKRYILMKEGLDLLRGQSAKADRLRVTYLVNMTKLLCDSGLDGTKEAKEAVEIADRLAAREPIVFWKLRIDAREALSGALEAARQPREQLVVLKEKITIRRAHVPQSNATAKDMSELISDLERTSRLAGRLSDHDAAVDIGTEAFKLSSQYLANDPQYQHQHSEVLGDLAVRLSASKKHQEALGYAQQAVDLARARLLNGNADAYPYNLYSLIMSLLSLRDCFIGLGDLDASFSVSKEVFDLLKKCCVTDFSQFDAARARAIAYFKGELVFDIGQALWMTKYTNEAVQATALDALRYCSEYLPTVAGQEANSLIALNNLGCVLQRREEAESWVIPTMVSHARKWFESGTIDVPDFSQTLLNLAADQYQHGSFEEALDTLEEALRLLASYVEPALEAQRTDPSANTNESDPSAIAYYLYALEMKQALLVLSAKHQGDSPQRALETALEILDKIESIIALFPAPKFYRSRLWSGKYWRTKVLAELGDAVGARKAVNENTSCDFKLGANANPINSIDMFIAVVRCTRLRMQFSLQHLREQMSDKEVQGCIEALEIAGRDEDKFLRMGNHEYYATLLRGEHDFWPHDRSMLS